MWDMWECGGVEEETCEGGEGHTPCPINLLIGLLYQTTYCLPATAGSKVNCEQYSILSV